MNREEILKKTNDLGVTTTPEIINQISDMVSKIAADTMLSAGEVEALTNIMILKACDTALLDKRTIITVNDVLSSLNFVCVPFFFPCAKSNILENPRITASVITPSDVNLLESLGITKNDELDVMSTTEIANKAVSYLKSKVPSMDISSHDFDLFNKRIEIWKLQANILSTLNK
jgi:hypothetical protein